MQGRIDVEDLQQQLGRQAGVQWHAGLEVLIELDVTLDDDQRAAAGVGQALGGAAQRADDALDLGRLGCRGEDIAGAPETLEGAPDLRSEDDRHGDEHRRQRATEQVRKGRQGKQAGQQQHGQQQQHHASQQHGTLRAAQQPQQEEEDGRDQQQIDEAEPVQPLEGEDQFLDQVGHGEFRRRRAVSGRLPGCAAVPW